MQIQSPILPITSPKPKSAIHTGTMFLQKTHDELPTTRLLITSSYDDEKAIHERRSLLPRASSYDGFSNGHATSSQQQQQQQRRRRANSQDPLVPYSDEGPSIGENVEHAAAETYLVTRLSLTLLRYLGIGYRWITRFLALGCYALLLMPGFIQVGYHYFFSRKVHRSIVYGDQPRNRLDLYLPENSNGPLPVVAFITGGAWIIGYKAWGSLLGQQLAERDIIVACIDYRNFPQGTIGEMVKDASKGISYVCNNIHLHGGDPNRIFLMGQSAGAHIGACALVDQAIKESCGKENITWSVSQIKAYFGLSGGYNLFELVDHFHTRGLYRRIFLSIMEGEESLRQYSPEVLVQDPSARNAVALLPSVVLFHGTADYSIPSDASKSFAETLQRLGVKAESILYEGKTHTDLFLQDPMRGGQDDLFEDLLSIVHADDEEALTRDAVAPARRRLVPEFMLRWAHNISPF